MNTFQAFVFGLALGYVLADARRPRTLAELRSELQRQEGVPATVAAESSDTAGRTGD